MKRNMTCRGFEIQRIESLPSSASCSSLAEEEVLCLRAALPVVLVVRVEVEAVVDVDLLAAGHRPHHPDHLVVLQSANRLASLHGPC